MPLPLTKFFATAIPFAESDALQADSLLDNPLAYALVATSACASLYTAVQSYRSVATEPSTKAFTRCRGLWLGAWETAQILRTTQAFEDNYCRYGNFTSYSDYLDEMDDDFAWQENREQLDVFDRWSWDLNFPGILLRHAQFLLLQSDERWRVRIKYDIPGAKELSDKMQELAIAACFHLKREGQNQTGPTANTYGELARQLEQKFGFELEWE